jgi:hypothetical protein
MKSDFDASGKPVLFHREGEAGGVPARDLSHIDLARIAWLRLGDARPLTPREVPAGAIAKVRDDLLATGKYGAKPVTPATEDTDD